MPKLVKMSPKCVCRGPVTARAQAFECLPGLPVRGWAGPQGVRTVRVSLTPKLVVVTNRGQ